MLNFCLQVGDTGAVAWAFSSEGSSPSSHDICYLYNANLQDRYPRQLVEPLYTDLCLQVGDTGAVAWACSSKGSSPSSHGICCLYNADLQDRYPSQTVEPLCVDLCLYRDASGNSQTCVCGKTETSQMGDTGADACSISDRGCPSSHWHTLPAETQAR